MLRDPSFPELTFYQICHSSIYSIKSYLQLLQPLFFILIFIPSYQLIFLHINAHVFVKNLQFIFVKIFSICSRKSSTVTKSAEASGHWRKKFSTSKTNILFQAFAIKKLL